MLHLLPAGHRSAEHFQGFVFGSGGKSEIAGIFEHLAPFHHFYNFIFYCFFFIHGVFSGQGHVHFGRHAAALAGMGFIYDNGKLTALVFCADFVQYIGKFMDGGDDDLFPLRDQFFQVPGAFRMPNGIGNLHKLLYGILDLLIQIDPVSHHNHGIKDWNAILFQPDQLVGRPGNGVGLAASRAVLNKIFLPGAFFPGIGEERLDYGELVEPREDLLIGLFLCPLVFFHHYLGKIFYYIGKLGF